MVGEPLRKCTKCLQDKEPESFHKKRNSKDGRSRTCKDCDYVKVTESRKRNPRTHTDYWLKQKYGISIEEFDVLYDKQGGVCAVCSKSTEYRLCVDHRHDTGKIRGLLCRPCNKAIGQLGDTPEGVLKAYGYLKETHGND